MQTFRIEFDPKNVKGLLQKLSIAWNDNPGTTVVGYSHGPTGESDERWFFEAELSKVEIPT